MVLEAEFCSSELLPILFPNAILPKDDRICFVPGERLILQWVSSRFGHRLSGGGGIHTCGHPLSCNLSKLGPSDTCTCVYGGTASLASPAIVVSLEIMSRNLAAAIREPDGPCSVNTALYPRCCPPRSRLFLCTSGDASHYLHASGGKEHERCKNEQIFRHMSLVEPLPPWALLS